MASTLDGAPVSTRRTALILYGTETGNSEECAGELGRMLERLHFTADVTEMDNVEINVLLQYTIVAFAVSTTGQGEFPRNARKFWKSLLRKRLPPGCLARMKFTTFGLGDSSYSKFNWTARKLHKRLEQLGGQEIYPRGEADDQHEDGWDGTFLSWKTDFGKHVLEQFPLPDGSEPIPPDQPLQPKLLLETLPQIQTSHQSDVTSQGRNLNNQQSTSHPDVSPNNFSLSESTANFPPIMTSDNPLPAAPLAPWITPPPSVCQQLKEPHPDIKLPLDKDLPPDTLLNIRRGKTCELLYNKRVTPQSHWQDVRQLTLLVPDHATWLPGDVVTIYPKNFPDDVQALIDLQEWNEYADVPLQLVKSTTSYQTNIRTSIVSGIPESLRLVKGSTLRDLLTNNLDITAIPKRNFLQNMSYFTSDAMHRERLQEFCQPLYTDEFFDYCTRPRRSILEVLTDFPTVKFPWNQAAWIFPSIRGRQFSIANSSETAEWHQDSSEREVELLVAIVKYRTVLKKIRQGLCSRYLSSLEEGSKMQISFDRPSDKFYDLAFREKKRPIIMIAAGTGIAPCRNLTQERASLASQRRSQDEQMGKMLLIYGSRNHSSDYFFQDDWISRDISKHLTVKTAFSRDQRDKIYVQDIIKRDKEDIYKLIEEGAVIYVCGSAGAMPKSVRQAILDVLCEFVDVGSGLERVEEVVKEKSEALLEQMSKVGRYVEEVW